MTLAQHPFDTIVKNLRQLGGQTEFATTWVRRLPGDGLQSFSKQADEGWALVAGKSIHPRDLLQTETPAHVIHGEGCTRDGKKSWTIRPDGSVVCIEEAVSAPESSDGWVPVISQTSRLLSKDLDEVWVYAVYWSCTDEMSPLARIASRLVRIEYAGESK